MEAFLEVSRSLYKIFIYAGLGAGHLKREKSGTKVWPTDLVALAGYIVMLL